MMRLFRNSLLQKIMVLYLMGALVGQCLMPVRLFALTSGPAQPEVQSFTPVGTTEMVDLSSGDFTYNIPLLSVEGYPVNLSYQSGIGMEDEASMVGLGWNLNIGQINRSVRGLPDDFNGDKIMKKFHVKPDVTLGVTAGLKMEWAGVDATVAAQKLIKKIKLAPSLSLSLGVTQNNYRGMGVELGVNPGVSLSAEFSESLTGSLGIGGGLSLSSMNGASLDGDASASFSYTRKKKIEKLENQTENKARKLANKYYGASDNIHHTNRISSGIGGAYNTRGGLQQISLQGSLSYTRALSDERYKGKDGGMLDKILHSHTASQGGTASLHNFVASVFTPGISMPFKNQALSFSGTIGIEVPGWVNPSVSLSGYYASQRLAYESESVPAYGYMNLHHGQLNNEALMDFARENDRPFIQGSTPLLPLAYLTNDHFAISGHGVSGVYRPYRSDIGYVSDRSLANKDDDGKDVKESDSKSAGIEIGAGGLSKIGLNVSPISTQTESGPWKNNNDWTNEYSFQAQFPGAAGQQKSLYEPAYFKQVGELTGQEDEAFFDDIGGYDPVSVPFDTTAATHQAKARLSHKKGRAPLYEPQKTLSARTKRNQPFSYLNGYDAKVAGLDTTIKSYSLNAVYNAATGLAYSDIERVKTGRPGHHISEITVLKDDGVRYVYGIPAVNTYKKEVTFSVAGLTPACGSDQVVYTPGTDNSLENKRGLDNYYDEVTTPSYAASYLLTAILSPDYSDLTGNGPSDDDYGTYYSIKYHKQEKSYQWRFPLAKPVEENGEIVYKPVASFNVGFKSRDGENGDDKGSYVYGTRENWYIAYLESRNQIAVFTYSSRKDALGVVNEEGDINLDMSNADNKTLKLDKITLYSKKDWQEHGSAARKLKEVIFHYDYSLCPGIYNFAYADGDDLATAGGKLTLRRIEMISENSGRARFSPYEFSYADPDHDGTINSEYNPAYHPNDVDRWGMYMENMDCTLPNSEFPYTNQAKASGSYPYLPAEKSSDWRQRDIQAGAWLLNTIKTPGGGVIKVDYESDDYAYIQDKRAGQMFKLLGFSHKENSPQDSLKQELYSFKKTEAISSIKDNRYVYVKLDQPVSNEEEFVRKYIGKENRRTRDNGSGVVTGFYQLFFNLSLDVDSEGNWDRVPAYVFVEDHFQLLKYDNSSSYNVAVIAVEQVPMKEKNKKFRLSELLFASMNHARLNLPEYVFDGSAPMQTDNNLKEKFSHLLSFAQSISTVLLGIHRTMIIGQKCRKVRPEQSWVRLANPDGFKHGGNSRVWRIRMDNNLSAMTSEASSEWGTLYDYTTTNESNETISSGVASYEPLLGGDEISLKRPVSYEQERRLYPDDAFYIELPLGEYVYNASIVYSKVRIRNLPKDGVIQQDRAYTQHEFYTAKDYPVVSEATELDDFYEEPGLAKKMLQQGKYLSTNSQGYVIRINSMHGAPKSQLSFVDDEKSAYAGSISYYRDKEIPRREIDQYGESPRASVRVLNNEKVPTLTREGQVKFQTMGREVDFVVDSREQKSITKGFSVNYNLDLAMNGLPIPLFTLFGSVTNQEKRFRSLTTTKVISEAAILDSVVNIQDGTRIKTAYTYYDAESGVPLVSSVTNEYKDTLFSTSMPAHWVYEGMGMAYKNQGMTLRDVNLSTLSSPESYFVKGDEVLLDSGNGIVEAAWVLSVGGPGGLHLIDRYGDLINLSAPFERVQTIRSGRRNQANAPVASVATRKNPVVNNSTLAFGKVLNASATEFSDEWQVLSPLLANDPGCGCENPTQQAADFLSWLNELQSHQFYTGASLVHLNQIAAFTGSGLATELGFVPGTDWYWQTKVQTVHNLDVLLIRTDAACGLDTVCSLSLNIDPQSEFAQVAQYNLISASDANCATSGAYTIQATKTGGQATVTGSTACFNVRQCETSPFTLAACYEIGDTVNPYVAGIRGVWLPKKSYTYLTGRTLTQPSASIATNIRGDGTFTSFVPFWSYATATGWTANPTDWVWTAEATRHLPFGIDVESRDVLDRYSSAQYGYRYQVPVAISANSPYKDMGAANFEYADDIRKGCGAHFSFVHPGDMPLTLTDKESHTGLQSAVLTASKSSMLLRTQVTSDGCTPQPDAVPYTIDACDVTRAFSPAPGKYVVSFWVKGDAYNASALPVTEYPGVTLDLKIDNQTLAPLSENRRQLIDGWERREYLFDIPAGGQALELSIQRQAGMGSSIYFIDDFRFFGFLSSMKTYVYDPINLRLLAELDANNYATFYQYDAAGNPVSFKRETQRGIQTLKEVRSNQYNAYE